MRDAKENGDLWLVNRDSSWENGTDPVDEADYASWRGDFGMSLSGGADSAGASPSQNAVPEPGTVMLGALAGGGLLLA